MQITDEIGVKNLEAYGDSKLIVNQFREEYEVRNEDLVPYYNATISMAERFENFLIEIFLHTKYRILDLEVKMCKVLNSNPL